MYTNLSGERALEALGSSLQGLTSSSVLERQKEYGRNELPHKEKSLFLLFLSQFNDVMVYILLGALALSAAMPFFEAEHLSLKSFLDSFVILAILIINAALGFMQEYKAEEAIEMLKKLTSPHTRVRRHGQEQVIPSADLVPGDIVILEAGDKVSADGRIIKHSHLRVNESSLTGESHAIDKTAESLPGENLSLADQRNMVFSGTLVTRGYGEYLVTSTATNTEIGKIATLVSETEFPETPLQKRMGQLGTILGIIVISLSALVVFIGALQNLPFTEILLIGVSLAVSAVPEGLPAVVTVCLAMGVRRMAKKNALVRRLESLETLGSVTVICSDKTGTITQNKMTVIESWLNTDAYDAKHLAQIGMSCNRAQLPDIGDPTEIGLLEFGKSVGAERLAIDEEEVPFSSEEKYMQTRHGNRVFIKGAPEKVFAMSIDETDDILKKNEELAARGLRVLACAEMKDGVISFVGLIAMEDPPRQTALNAITRAKTAGIRTIMITGDNRKTAAAIAEQVGIEGKTLHGSEIDQLTQEQLITALDDTSVFARVSPEHKLRILEALQERGEIVAMSGDGVNDAPALKGSHVGIAMGKVGTEVAREASSIVLADDHFATIVNAIAEGRRIYDNIKKFVVFLLRTNFDELLFISTCIFIGLPLPYLALHILWINLLTDSLPALALGMEKAEPDIMNRPPRNPKEHLLAGEAGRLAFAAIIGFSVSFLTFLWLLSRGTPLVEARSVTLTLGILFELFVVHSLRSTRPIYHIGFFSNRLMWGAVAVPFVLQILLLTTPMGRLFHVVPIYLWQWVMVFGIAAAGFLFFETLKLFHRS